MQPSLSPVQAPIQGFAPIEGGDAEVLILGSMPSEESLRLKQYYAHPRNAFWPIMMNLLNSKPHLAYDERASLLINNRIAVWDTLRSCVRSGSLDSAIVDASIETNDFNAFFRQHREICHIFFNGQKSGQVYRKYVLPGLVGASPAMASLDRNQKTRAWRIILDVLKHKPEH